MAERLDDKKITIKTAALTLNVSTKTIQRYLARGLLTKCKEGTRTLVFESEVRALAKHPVHGARINSEPELIKPCDGYEKGVVTLPSELYENLLLELAELRLKGKENRDPDTEARLIEHGELLKKFQEELNLVKQELRVLESRLNEHIVPSEAKATPPKPSTPADGQKPKKPWWQV